MQHMHARGLTKGSARCWIPGTYRCCKAISRTNDGPGHDMTGVVPKQMQHIMQRSQSFVDQFRVQHCCSGCCFSRDKRSSRSALTSAHVPERWLKQWRSFKTSLSQHTGKGQFYCSCNPVPGCMQAAQGSNACILQVCGIARTNLPILGLARSEIPSL